MDEDWENEANSNAAPVVQPAVAPVATSFSGFSKSNDINNNVDDNDKPSGGGDRFAKSFGGFKKEGGENGGGERRVNFSDRNNGGGGGFKPRFNNQDGDRNNGDRPPFRPRREGGFGGGQNNDGNGGGGGFNNRERRPFGDRPQGGGGGGGGFGGFRRNQDGGENGGGEDGGDKPKSFGGFGGKSFGGNREGGFGGNRDGGSGGGGGFGGFRRNQDGGENGGGEDGGDKPKPFGGFGGKSFGGNRDGGSGGGGFGGFGNKGFGGNRDKSNEGGRDGEKRSFGGFGGNRGGEGGGDRRPFGGFGGNRGDRPPRDGDDGGERKPFGGFGGNRGDRPPRDGGDGERKAFGGFGNRGDRPPRDEQGGPSDGIDRRERYIPTYDEEETEEKLFHSMSVGINFKKQAEIPVNLSGNGSETIVPIERFDEAKLSDLLLSNVKKSNYEIPTPVQKYAIPIVLGRRDLMACAQTGSGKTAAFVLPIMTNILHDGIESSGLMTVQRPQALILSPTRELALQIFHECKKFSHGSIIKSAILYGGVDTGFQLRGLEKGCNILVATPGRLLDILEKGKISLEKVKYFVLDEADRMLDMGFEKNVREILEKGKVDTSKDRCTLMFSATFPKEIQKLAQDFLHNYLFLAIGIVGGANTDVEQKILKVGRFEKRDEIIKIIDEIGNERIMIFMEHKKQADILAFYLLQKKYPCTSIHGDRLQSQRETALAEFKSGKSKIIVCTSVAARGLDIEKVSYVINYDLPQSIDEYVHRIGRTGRCGNLGKAISFFDPNSENDRKLARSLVITLRQASQEIPEWLAAVAEDSYGTSFARDTGTDDLREQFNKFSVNSEPVAASAAAASADVDESWE